MVCFNRSNRPTVRSGWLTAVARGGSDPDSGAGMLRVTRTATGGGARMCGHGFPLIARENSKYQYPKGTPFVLIFLYLYTSNFHPMANVGLNAFSYL